MFFNRGDVAATAVVCDRVPQNFVMACFKSLGREITAWADQEHPRTIEMCGRVGETGGGRGRIWCLDGAVETLINQSADARDGIRFCRAVDGAAAKESCYSAVGWFMTALVAEPEGRAQQCAAAEPEFVAACRRAAQAEPPAPPAGT
jgi:hypothetical protein